MRCFLVAGFLCLVLCAKPYGMGHLGSPTYGVDIDGKICAVDLRNEDLDVFSKRCCAGKESPKSFRSCVGQVRSEVEHERARQRQEFQEERAIARKRVLDFMRIQDSLPKPSACIRYLMSNRTEDVSDVISSLHSVDLNFNDRFDYPILVYHDGLDTSQISVLTAATKSNISFVYIPDYSTFPEWVDTSRLYKHAYPGYLHMLRWMTRQWLHAEANKFDYFWRVDSDAVLPYEVPFDVFRFMAHYDIIYGYSVVGYDNPDAVSVGLHDAFMDYKQKEKLPWTNKLREAMYGIYGGKTFGGEFELGQTAAFSSEQYKRFVDYFDRLGGQYYHRWGDNCLRSLFLWSYYGEDRVNMFEDVPYFHQWFNTCPDHTNFDTASRTCVEVGRPEANSPWALLETEKDGSPKRKRTKKKTRRSPSSKGKEEEGRPTGGRPSPPSKLTQPKILFDSHNAPRGS